MIRINLLAVERGASSRPAMIPAAHRVTISASLILLATALVLGWWFWSLRQTSIQIDEEIARAEVETQQLRSVLSQVQQFETRKAQLQQRVTLIEQLRRGQSGPVHMLDEISRSLPERLWLTEMSQKGQEITRKRILEGLEEDPLALHRELDWVAKYHLVQAYRSKHDLPLAHPRVSMLDLAYHDVNRTRGLYYLLEKQDRVERILRGSSPNDTAETVVRRLECR